VADIPALRRSPKHSQLMKRRVCCHVPKRTVRRQAITVPTGSRSQRCLQ
jgi:hypothetical protein